MPIQNWNKATYDNSYEAIAEKNGHPNTRPPVKLHYNRVIMKPDCDIRAQNLVRLLNLNVDTHILIIGAGFGWTAEALRDNHGITNIIATDTSEYVQQNKINDDSQEIRDAILKTGLDPDSREGQFIFNQLVSPKRSNIEIYEEDLLTQNSRRRILRLLNNRIDIVLTEYVMSTLTDDEAINLSKNLHDISNSSRIVHLDVNFTNSKNVNYNYKYLRDWSRLIPGDIWIDGSTYKVF